MSPLTVAWRLAATVLVALLGAVLLRDHRRDRSAMASVFIAGVNDLTVGFGASVIGTCLAYVLGQRAARGQHKAADRAPS